jgi:hypothetical protein
VGYPDRLGCADGLYIGLGIDGGIGYSAESQRRAEALPLDVDYT